MKDALPDQAGWYKHPEMVNTLCYWDGSAWTDKVQPMGDREAINEARKKLVGSLIAIAIIVLLIYGVATAL